MKIPADGTTIYDKPFSRMWFDDEGILNVITKNTPRTLQATKENLDFVRQIANGKLICAIADVSYSGMMDRETRQYVKKEFPKVYKALAILTHSALGKMIGTLLAAVISSSVPTKIFTDENQAREWIRQYLSPLEEEIPIYRDRGKMKEQPFNYLRTRFRFC